MTFITKNDMPTHLTSWQKAQAAMLYHFTSAEYLIGLHKMVGDLLNGFVDPLLEAAKAQGRDNVLFSETWGERNFSSNWENNAWPFLRDLQISIATSIARRQAKQFSVTAVNESLRGVAEYSTDWTTPGEERLLNLALATISEYAAPHDKSVEIYQNKWNDYRFAYVYRAFARLMLKVPKFQVRAEVSGFSGEVPPQTGVYMSVDDPHASLQFVWSEPAGPKIRTSNTFNEIGLAALSFVGRQSLWFDEAKMFEFATAKPYAERFRDSVFLYGEPYPSLAPAAVARSAFKSRPCQWALVDIVPGEFEGPDLFHEPEVVQSEVHNRIAGGELCTKEGYYFTPSMPGTRRYFAIAETAPNLSSSYGKTYWQWDANQEQ
ncbi:hypothetical protein [Massilia niabensis]|uniref:DUF4433 domain-containing protein n=1 Tax=Massilia niabensis TaxID=544910 RepID=A0ABW0LC45_9BURK